MKVRKVKKELTLKRKQFLLLCVMIFYDHLINQLTEAEYSNLYEEQVKITLDNGRWFLKVRNYFYYFKLYGAVNKGEILMNF